ncbi:MAG: class I SAM-dependent methyltransferase [Proteobacteria bacterium]|nr:class I SAM-dependent methyltransferase [Pseudomonadota bacterium]MBU1696341.1 class I SAM-dependent methyltransferase [Pseudomonadota bacterium]
MNKDPYKKLSKFYDTFIEPSVAVLRKIMFKMYIPKEGMRVLEVGCGTGTNLKLYQQAGCEVYGIDLSPSMVKVASKKLGEQADIKLGDASQMPYSDGYFDLVIAMLTLHEMPNSIRPPVMDEMARVMKQDGRLLLVDFHPGPIRFPKGWLSKINILFFERIAGREHFRNYRDFIAGKGLPPLIETNNLYVEKKKVVGGGNLALFSATKAN